MRTTLATLAVWSLSGVLAAPAFAADAPPRPAAKVASAENRVETRAATEPAWRPAVVAEPLRALDRIRTGPASRAAILYSDQTLHRMNEKSEIEIAAAESGRGGMLRVLSGQHHFTSRTPRDFDRVRTATVTAAIRGTEFVVDVADDGATAITMIEGTVAASNEYGSLSVGAGEQAYVEPGKAPQRRVVVRPRDAVAWALYYPPVLGGRDVERLASLGADGEALQQAAGLLSAGQVAAARPLVERALAARPEEPAALALASVISVTTGDRDEGLRLAERGAKADPDSAAAAMALSFAAQARFDIARARDEAERAARLDPKDSEALARVAELRMAEGDLDGAGAAAGAAVARAPGQARALAVLGFAELARRRTSDARGAFERAVAADPALPLARLGLGIALFRSGETDRALEELQTATALDPDDAVTRSYLGKAYYELRRSDDAGKELERAKTSDPLDPTPHLYDAIRLQNGNRPVEALDELAAAIERNDRRAVYRSRLLLDQDLAARGADLARIYNDLGFEQAGLVSARRSADEDQANHSSHLFLAGNYRSLPGYAFAFLSEVLQARLYQPTGVNAVRPDVVSDSSVSFNEYTALFDRPRARFFGGGSLGQSDTDLGRLRLDGQPCIGPGNVVVPCANELDDSSRWSGEALATLHGDRYSLAVGAEKRSDDGFRANNDVEQTNYRGFFQWAPSWRDDLQLNVLSGTRETGDLPLRETPMTVSSERFDTDQRNVGVGWHRRVSAASDLVVSAIFNETEQRGRNPLFGTDGTGRLRGPQLEFQQVLRRDRVTWIFGGGAFDGTFRLADVAGTRLTLDDRFFNGYAYAKLRRLGIVELTAGVAFEKADSPTGLLPPRDSITSAVETAHSDSRVSPKLGVSIFANPSTVVRLAAYARLSPFLGRLQTLEPTQVAGFNQFFEDAGGTRSTSYGVGLDQQFGRRVFAGFSLLRRDLTSPEAYCEFPDPFTGCNFQAPAPGLILERSSDDDLATAYVHAAFGRRVTGSIQYLHEDSEFDRTQVTPTGIFEDRVRTRRLRPEARVILPGGFFATLRGTRYDQRVEQFDDFQSSVRFRAGKTFWIGDLSVGYRLPERWGTVSLDVRNASDQEYDFFLASIQDDVIPTRSAVLRLRVTY